MNKTLLLLSFFISSYAFSQNLSLNDTLNLDYQKELSDLYASRVQEQVKVFENQITDRRELRSVKEAYFNMSSAFSKRIEDGYFYKDDFLQAFVNNILKKIQESNPDHPDLQNTRLILSYGTSPNAYAIGHDIIVINTGLLKSIANEYEIAYIMSHELAHNLLEHSYNHILEMIEIQNSSDIKKQTSDIRRQRYNRGQLASNIYRDLVYDKRQNDRRLEHQADSLGFILYKNAFKDKAYQAIHSLKTLDSIDIEYESLSLSDYKNLLNTEKVSFKEEWISNDEIKSYNYDTSQKFWLIDSLKTHPDCDIRVEFIENNFKVEESKLEPASTEYESIKEASIINHLIGLYTIEEYGRALYESLLLYREDPKNKTLKNLIALNLDKLYSAQKNYELNKYMRLPNPRYSDGYNEFLYAFRQIRNHQLKTIIEKYSN